MLITANRPKAIGETIPITLVNDFCKKKVNINPNKNMDSNMPPATTKPKIIIFFC